MSFEDLIQLLILGGAALAWLLGGSKAKRAPPPERPQRPQQPPQRSRRATARDVKAAEPPTTVVVRPQGRQRLPADTMADEIYRILSGELEATEQEESLEIIREEALPTQESLEEIREAEAYSLETLEPAGEASHRRFHEKYLGAGAAAASLDAPRGARRPALGAGSLRQAILWHEILGPPKAYKD